MPLIQIAGSERFAYRPKPAAETRRLAGRLPLHDVTAQDIAAIDPLTYEVLRHRLAATVEEMGEGLKRMSGSVVVTDCNDFGATLLDECGDAVVVGLYNTQLAASVDMAAKWTLENRAMLRSGALGIRPGDMFFCNDPWVGGGLHQNDATVLAPLFHGDELFAWTAAVCHQVDLGGVSPGSWSVEGRDVFWESTPVPPVKIVEGGHIREDVEDMYLRRSRVPRLIALDLRAKIGANHIAQERLTQLIAKYGATTVKAVMKRMMNDAEARLRAKLRELPDGQWSGVAHQDSFRSGDREVHRIALTMAKQGDRLRFDFSGTDREVEGFANCTYAGLRGGIMPIVLTMLCGDIPWAPGGLYRCLDIVSEPGTLNNCNFPAGIGKASVASAWATQNVVSECVAGLLAVHPEHRKSLMCVCCGSWDLALLAGLDQRGNPFVTMVCDSMAGGLGARVDQDGVDTGGLNCIPMGRVADVEINEFSFPMLYLWRREEMDSGGPGRFRGGAGGSSCFIPYDTPIGGVHLVVSATGKALPQASGASGGFPAGTQHDVLVRGANVRALLAAGRIPGALEEVGGTPEVLQQHLQTQLNDGDVYYTHWQGGGGYGDPLLRNPILVARDVATRKVSPAAARATYGVVLAADGTVDESATAAQRQALRTQRAAPMTA
ncbi:hydantoinase B/oxoprolinase family protein [Pseudorhodoferax sp.]|uniref:hydantoinase B/oxoprolinase family protein n=1 Tax=Pseudorhodoferax sp. TaxID=1993553 RepID=UPI002DD6AC33|nr:hydantoinase B/oxoprolinase family protein [Pseudorhodoferax sp.]